MASNAYIARGNRDGKTVMKVGKANNILQREKQIAVSIEFTIACLDAEAAFRVESQLRDFVVGQGCIRYHGTIDWFEFDQRVYEMLSEFASNVKAEPPFDSEEDEISLLLNRYHQLLAQERQLAALRAELDNAIARLQMSTAHLKLEAELKQEISYLQAQVEILQEELKAAQVAQ